MQELLRDRRDAGVRLARLLTRFRADDLIVLALPRGGVPVAYEIARALHAPLDVFVARKIGAPMHPEFGIGAIAEGGVRVLDAYSVHSVGATRADIEATIARETAELERRVARYRKGRPLPDLSGRTVLLVDDGIATGGTIRAAIRAVRSLGSARIVVVAPVASAETTAMLANEADEVVCLTTPTRLQSIGRWYLHFEQVSDEEVLDLLDMSRDRQTLSAELGWLGTREITIPTRDASLEGILDVPSDPQGLVVFVHGSGSSRNSPRNRAVARSLHDVGLATLLFDLLTPREEAVDAVDARLRFDIPFLAERLLGVTDWLTKNPSTSELRIGYFGASTGAAAALVAAAERRSVVRAVVSRGGRPDLAGNALPRVGAPTLLIVGSRDHAVIELNRAAATRLRCANSVAVVRGASHLFEEPGALDRVADLASEWFLRYLGATVARERA